MSFAILDNFISFVQHPNEALKVHQHYLLVFVHLLADGIWCDEPSCKDAAKYWQPIAIQTVDKAKDNLLNAFAPSKVAEDAVNQIVKSKEVQDYLRENKEFIEKVGQVTGSFQSCNESSTLWSLADIADTVMAEMENGKNMTEFKYKFGKLNQTVFDKLNEFLLK